MSTSSYVLQPTHAPSMASSGKSSCADMVLGTMYGTIVLARCATKHGREEG